MNRPHGRHHIRLVKADNPATDVARAYNRAANGYLGYADGDPKHLFSFEGHHAYADRQLWSVLDTKLCELRSAGTTSISILDAGCGPGTWLRRLVMHARRLGFSSITARGFDVAQAQIHIARDMAHDLAELPGVTLTFEVADVTDRLSSADASIDMTLCLYSVLSHLPVECLPKVAAEVARVTKGHFITTVRSIGSPPTIFVDSIEKARHLRMDHGLNRCNVEFPSGRRIALPFHLFSPCELQDYFAPYFAIEDLCGLDIFHDRFAPDRRWNPPFLQVDQELSDHLAQLEKTYARNPHFMQRATHLLLAGRRRQV